MRPGPIQGGAVNPYIERRQRLRVDPGYQVPYEHPSLEPALSETLGTIIFQDQVLEVAIAFAGFSAGEAEGLRRAMSRKRSEAAIEAHHATFVAGAIATHGVDAELAERVFEKVQRLLGLRLPQGARGGLRAARLPVDVAARPLRARVPVRAAERAADGLLPARRARARGAAARASRCCRRTSTQARSSATVERVDGRAGTGSVRIGLGYVRGVAAGGCRGAGRRSQGRRAVPRSVASWPRAPAPGAPALELLAWSGACDRLAGGDRRDRAVAPRRGDAGPPRAAGHAARARPGAAGRARPAAARPLGASCSPTTTRPA